MKKYLILIVILAAALRLPFLGQFPNGFTGDEAQQGYSAYSIFKTGKDEWGEVLPLFPRGFGDFKPPLYTYLTVPSVAILGLTPEAVRLPAALVGILSVWIVYFLVKELFQDKKTAIWSSLLLGLNPWHIQLSRTAFEGGVGVLTFSLGLLFFLKSGTKNLILAAIFWGLMLYSYHSWRMFLVLLLLGLLITYRKKLLVMKNWIAGLILATFFLPLAFNVNSLLARSSDVSITSKNQITGYFQNKVSTILPYQVDRIFENKILFVGDEFIKNYLSYFSPSFFFTGARSDSSYLNFPGFGLLLLVELPFWLFAGYKILFSSFQNKKIILLWFLLAPLSAAMATGGMNAGRTPNFLPLTAMVSAVGVVVLLNLSQKKYKNFILVGILSISLLYFLYFYFIKLPNNPPYNLRYGYDVVFKKALELEGEYDHIVFSKAFTEPQIFIAFYSRMDPITFQKSSKDWLRYEQAGRLYLDQLESWNLGKFLFEDLNWYKKDSLRKNALIIGEPKDFPQDEESILDVKDPKGKIIYRLVSTN